MPTYFGKCVKPTNEMKYEKKNKERTTKPIQTNDRMTARKKSMLMSVNWITFKRQYAAITYTSIIIVIRLHH